MPKHSVVVSQHGCDVLISLRPNRGAHGTTLRGRPCWSVSVDAPVEHRSVWRRDLPARLNRADWLDHFAPWALGNGVEYYQTYCDEILFQFSVAPGLRSHQQLQLLHALATPLDQPIFIPQFCGMASRRSAYWLRCVSPEEYGRPNLDAARVALRGAIGDGADLCISSGYRVLVPCGTRYEELLGFARQLATLCVETGSSAM